MRLDCGAYDFKLTAGEVWYFEAITVKDFEITENAYTIRDDLMLPFKFSEQQFETLPLIAQCDEIMPFMFSTENGRAGRREGVPRTPGANSVRVQEAPRGACPGERDRPPLAGHWG